MPHSAVVCLGTTKRALVSQYNALLKSLDAPQGGIHRISSIQFGGSIQRCSTWSAGLGCLLMIWLWQITWMQVALSGLHSCHLCNAGNLTPCSCVPAVEGASHIMLNAPFLAAHYIPFLHFDLFTIHTWISFNISQIFTFIFLGFPAAPIHYLLLQVLQEGL